MLLNSKKIVMFVSEILIKAQNRDEKDSCNSSNVMCEFYLCSKGKNT